ncbi:MAG: metallophosphoesterase [Prevotellaceae bacterium]|nr:metallophosphoesterase [Prevotellaceae bacterium]
MLFFLRMAIVLLILIGLPTLGIYWRFLRRKPQLRVWRRVLLSIVALLCIGTIWYVSSGFHTGKPEWLCRLFIHSLLGVSFAEIAICVGSLLALLFKKIPFLSRTLICLGFTMGALSLITTVMAYLIGNKRIEVKEYTFASKDLPEAFDGFRIVHISDLHLGTYTAKRCFMSKSEGETNSHSDRVNELIDKTLEQKGDVIVFTGDLVNLEAKEAEPFKEHLKRLTAPYGTYSILGNHDYAVYRHFDDKRAQIADIEHLAAIEKECGWHLLRNENAIIKKDNEQIAIIGVENDGKPPFPQLANLKKAQKGLPTDTADGKPLFKILLTHDPSHWRRNVLGETDIQLTLAGHTHGMQFKLGDWSPASWLYKEWGGQYYEGERSIVVSLGLGLGAVPFRFGAWSEICVITLKKI